MIQYIQGNLLENEKINYICHQVNCRKTMGTGIAKQIADKWPSVKEDYLAYINPSLGDITMTLVGERQAVVNFYSQYDYGTNGRKTDYEAFYKCLETLHQTTKKTSLIGFPYGIGCGLGGGDWEIIETMIKQVLWDRQVFIFNLNENCSKQYKVKNYCCYSQTDISREINKFASENPKVEIINICTNHDDVQWFLTIIYKE